MIKRTIEISSGPTHLSVRNGQLLISRDREVVGAVPCEDIGVVIADHPAVTYTQAVFTTLARNGAVIIACGADHHPATLIYPFEANVVHTERLRLQVESSRPCSKRIWRQIVKAKVRAQANVIGTMNPAFSKLMALAAEVRSGDPSNVEAQGAKVYWKALFPDGSFRRDPDGAPPNNLLNYGYMALRAAVARAICAAGFHPSIGFHHRNRYNAFCLADDLMEPLRPLVDARVRILWVEGQLQIDRDAKTKLLEVFTERVCVGSETGPLLVALSKMMASLVRVLQGADRYLEIPTSCS